MFLLCEKALRLWKALHLDWFSKEERQCSGMSKLRDQTCNGAGLEEDIADCFGVDCLRGVAAPFEAGSYSCKMSSHRARLV